MHPTLTITIDPLKGPLLNTNVSLEQTYLILSGMSQNVLVQLLASKEVKRILTPTGVS